MANYKKNLTELSKDHQLLNSTYLNELNKADINVQTVNVIKRVMNKLVDQSTGLLCSNCMEIKEIKTLQKLSNMEALNKKKYIEPKFINSLTDKGNLNVNLTNIGQSYNSENSESEGELSMIDFSPT